MDEKKMKIIIENCSDSTFRQLEEMVKKEREKRDSILTAEVNTMFTKIRELIYAIEERGFVLTYEGVHLDTGFPFSSSHLSVITISITSLINLFFKMKSPFVVVLKLGEELISISQGFKF